MSDPLIQRIIDGDSDAFEELMALHEKNVYGLAYRFTGSHHEALDIAQEVYIRIYNNISKFKGASSLSTWIYRITNNCCIDHIRKNKRHNVMSIDERFDDDGNTRLDIPDTAPSPHEAYEQKAATQKVRDAIEKLSPKHRNIIILRDIEGLPYEEIAQILNISLGTVKSRLSRARESLKNAIISMERNESIHRQTSKGGRK